METARPVASNPPEFQQGNFTSNYLRMPNLPLNVYWEDIMASLRMASPLMDYPIIINAAQTIRDGQKMIWLQMCSKLDALKARGFLNGRYSSDDVLVQCLFKNEENFMDTC
jgi:hypothetical protein